MEIKDIKIKEYMEKDGQLSQLKNIYQNAYEKSSGLKLPKTLPSRSKFLSKVGNLQHDISVSDYRRLGPQHNNLAKYLLIANHFHFNEKKLKAAIERLAGKDVAFLHSIKDPEDFLTYLNEHPQAVIKGTSIVEKYQDYSAEKLKQEITDLVQTNPVVEFTEVRRIKRHFHLHIGPTNSGKTYEAIQMLKTAQKGVYLSPLRLLALEIYDTLSEDGVLCSMITGEEQILTPGNTVISQTIETADLDPHYDVAVIDEAQMLSDESRGHAWVRAIMGIYATNIYLCASPDAENILKKIIHKCHDTCDVTYHHRKTILEAEEEPFYLKENLKEQIRPGDAFILFSKRSVLDMAARLELSGVRASVIYGHLPPEIRKNEVKRFVEHETDVVVATDAIGMGINLPIRRILFVQMEKFDGKASRPLKANEIQQIAGRAGRFGLYEKGLVTAVTARGINQIKTALNTQLEPLKNARLAFPKLLLKLDKPLDDILTTWASIPAVFPYKKMSVEEMLYLYHHLSRYTNQFAMVPGGNDKTILYDMISCPLDIRNQGILAQWVSYCCNYTADASLSFPSFSRLRSRNDLEAWENYYKMLDLYHNFSLRLGKTIDEERLSETKLKTETKIISILSQSKRNYVRRCNTCGKILPMDNRFNTCQKCYF